MGTTAVIRLNNCYFCILIHFNSYLGGCCGSRSKKTRVGGWAWAWWLVTDVQRLSLEVSIKTVYFDSHSSDIGRCNLNEKHSDS